MERVQIAPLTAADHEAVAQLFHAVWHETQAGLQDLRMARHRDLDFFRKRVADRAERTIVAASDGEIAGFAIWTGGRLDSLFVGRRFRGKGIGAMLCAEAEGRMAKTGVPSFELDCIAGNQAAKAFYEAHGWRLDSHIMLENETPEGLCRIATWRMVKP